jgi:hypothetical protein
MKRNLLIIAGLSLAVSAFGADKKRLREELSFTPVPELPARAVALIKSAPAAERNDTASIVVETIVARHPAAAPTVVAAVARSVPAAASVAARAAVEAAPESRAAVAQAVTDAVAPRGLSSTPAPAPAPARSPRAEAATSSAPAPARQAVTPESIVPGNVDPSVRESANHAPSQGNVRARGGPIKYHKPLPEPPRRPVEPPVGKGNGPRRP